MKTFFYKAKNGPEEIVEGYMKAASSDDVVAQLSAKGYVAILVEENAASAGGDSRSFLRHLFGIKQKEIISFTRQMGTLLRSGVPMLRALSILAQQTSDKYFHEIILDIADKTKNGQAFSDSLKKYQKLFSYFYISMIKTGEENGTLDKSLKRIAKYYTKQAQIASKVRAALVYPLVILVMGILTIVFVFTNVMPRIIPLLLNLNTALPFPTRALISMSAFMRSNWLPMAVIFAIFVLIYKKALSESAFRGYLSAFKLKIPVFGTLVYKTELARFTRAIETSLQNGIPIVSAISISLPIISEEALTSRLSNSVKGLEVGETLSNTLKKSGVFPLFALNLMNVGEESGNITESLSEIAESFETECEETIDVLVTLLEPMMIIFIGLIVGFIVSAVLLPIFQLNMVQL